MNEKAYSPSLVIKKFKPTSSITVIPFWQRSVSLNQRSSAIILKSTLLKFILIFGAVAVGSPSKFRITAKL